MLKRCLPNAAALAVALFGTSSLAASPDADAARTELDSLRACETSELPPILSFIKKYRTSDDVDVRPIVAFAEMRIAFVYQYQSMKPEAKRILNRVVSEYENQTDERLQLTAAEARLQLSGLERDPRKRLKMSIRSLLVTKTARISG